MAMTDIMFILIFLPASLLTLAFKPHCQKYILLFLSLFYYACGSPEYFVLLLTMLIINVALAYVIQKSAGGVFSYLLLIIGILLNVGTLFYYKYYDFTIEGVNQVLGTAFAAKDLLLPLGISFFSFKSISLLTDV